MTKLDSIQMVWNCEDFEQLTKFYRIISVIWHNLDSTDRYRVHMVYTNIIHEEAKRRIDEALENKDELREKAVKLACQLHYNDMDAYDVLAMAFMEIVHVRPESTRSIEHIFDRLSYDTSLLDDTCAGMALLTNQQISLLNGLSEQLQDLV